MTIIPTSESARQHNADFIGLLPVVLAVFLGFLSVSIPLAALSLEVRDHLGFRVSVMVKPVLGSIGGLP